jgi:secretory carrier-associated membrane protein
MSTASVTQPPNYQESSVQNVNLDAIKRQQEELDRKAAELERKEQNLRNLEQGGPIKNNFPPLPVWFPLKPCFYQDISVEIPLDFQKWVRYLYYLWMYHGAVLFFNIITCLVFFIASGHGVPFGLSVLYFILFTPSSYLCWFRPSYKAFRSDSSFNFMVFFFVFFCHCVVDFFKLIGWETSGFGGVWFMIRSFQGDFSTDRITNYALRLFLVLSSSLFVLNAVADVFLLIKINRLYRGTGASFEQAQREFATNVMSNRTVQNAATTVITEGVRSATQPQQPGRF